MILSNSWKQHFLSLATLEEANKNIAAFSEVTDATKMDKNLLCLLAEDINMVVLFAGYKGKMKIFHSPKMFGGTRSRTLPKLIGMIGMGLSTYGVEFETSTLLA
eukprot:3542835-Ditylum_brightwellii.AAC.1